MANFPPNETELIDQYLDALWQDPDAAPPAGLDHDLAAFVRNLARAEQISPQAAKTVQARVWQRALIHARAAQFNQNNQQTGTQPMIGVYPNPTLARKPERTSRVTFGILAAAAAILVLISTSTLFRPSPVPQPPGAGASIAAAQASGTPTPAATASLVPTGTPFPVNIEFATIPPNLRPSPVPPDVLPPTLVPPPIGIAIPTIVAPCEVTVDYGVVIGVSTALPPTVAPPPGSSDTQWTPTPIPPDTSPVTVATPPCVTTIIGKPSLEVITLDIRALKPQGLRLGDNDDATGNRRFVGTINADTPYAYMTYGPGAEDKKWDISVMAAYENKTPQPDFSLIVFDLQGMVYTGSIKVWIETQGFNATIGDPAAMAGVVDVHYDADGGAGKDPELNGVLFQKGHRYGIYVFPGKSGQVGNFALNLTASTE